MGGPGSGFTRPRKAAVEDGLTLSISALMRKGALVPGSLTSGTWAWSYDGEEPFARVGYVGDMRTPEAATLRLTYTANGHSVDDVIRLVWTTPQFGGRRWYFQCPLDVNGDKPPRRATKLHLPPGAQHFGSREAYGLTYTSCRESRSNSTLYRLLAAETGLSAEAVRAALTRRNLN